MGERAKEAFIIRSPVMNTPHLRLRHPASYLVHRVLKVKEEHSEEIGISETNLQYSLRGESGRDI